MVSFKGSRSQFDAGTVFNFYLIGLGCPLLLELSDRRLRRCAATDSVVMQRVEVAVRSITGSSGHGTDSAVQNRDHRVFSGSMEATGS